MGKPISVSATKRASEAAIAAPSQVETNAEVKTPINTHRAKRTVPRDTAIVIALHTAINEVHAHDPIDAHDADRIFTHAVKKLTDRMLLPILSSGEDVLEGGNLDFFHDTEPVAPATDRHASKLVRKRAKRRKQSYAVALKHSIYGSYAPSRASTRTESKFGGSRFGGSRATPVSTRGVVAAPKLSLVYSTVDGESMVNSSWIGSQHGSSGTASNNTSWQPGGIFNRKNVSPPSSVAGTARIAVDFVELERRQEIERDIGTRESVRRSAEVINRKAELRVKLRSLADPTISLDKEEAMANLDVKGRRSRSQQSRQGPRGMTPGILQRPLSPMVGKRIGGQAPIVIADEVATFRTEDYNEISSDVVLLGKRGELVVGENCFVVAQKLRHELLLDLQSRGAVHPRIQLHATPKQEEEDTSNQSDSRTTSRSSPLQNPPRSPVFPEKVATSNPTVFGDQTGSYETSPILALDLQMTPLAKGVIMKINGILVSTSPGKLLASKKLPKNLKKSPLRENKQNAKLETQLNALIKVPDSGKPTGSMKSQSEPILQTLSADSPGSGSPVLPKHIYHGEKHLQSLRIRTPACPNRISRKTSSRSSLFVGSDEDGWSIEGMENLFSLHEQHSSTNSLPNAKYVREFPKPPQGRIQIFKSVSRDTDWTLPAPSAYSLASGAAPFQHKR